MLGGFIRSLLGARKPAETSKEQLLDQARECRAKGDLQGVIKALRAYLQIEPYDVPVLNDLGGFLVDTGDLNQAAAIFELAYSLDDTFLAGMVNRAKVLVDQHRSGEAMTFLQRAKIAEPRSLFADTIYASVCMLRGDVHTALSFQLRSWLSEFDSLRHANGYLFWIGYDDVAEETIAAEHRFWAETLQPLQREVVESPRRVEEHESRGRRLRIGYWSPDFRSHSVRYFSRPLIANHDRERFELFAFHDFPGTDAHTESVRALVDHFHDVHEMPDAELAKLFRSLDLDVLVELAGHTSYNRLHLLQGRFARVQITALGYPPTTGLRTVDAKLLDEKIVTPDAPRYYVERPLVLPSTFWCFDPMEPVPIAADPPMVANGFITFGCAGNISKISDALLRVWAGILAAVPDSRFTIRSVSFQDEDAMTSMRERLASHGLPVERMDLLKPQPGLAFFGSYDAIDIVLDTFPFNGGTTTSFATYMGVPVVTRAGNSLISRMGLSIMTSLDAGDLVAADWDDYARKAIALANNPDVLRRFKREARERYGRSALGNGKLFAREFEKAVESLLQDIAVGASRYESSVPALPARELVRRAYAVVSHGNVAAAMRIADHCLAVYPAEVGAHVLKAQLLAIGGDPELGIEYLEPQLERIDATQQVPALLTLVRFQLLVGREAAAAALLDQLETMAIEDEFDRAQTRLYRLASVRGRPTARPVQVQGQQRFHVVVPCDDAALFARIDSNLHALARTSGAPELVVERCPEASRSEAYERVLALSSQAIVVFLQKHLDIREPAFFSRIAQALETCEVVGHAGATRWSRMDWRLDEFGCKAGAFVTPSSERAGLVDLQLLGDSPAVQADGMAVLDGAVLAMRPSAVAGVAFDDELLGCETLLEEDWVHRIAKAGGRLAARRDLGVFVGGEVTLDASNRTEARLHCANKHGFEPFALQRDDTAALSVPVTSLEEALSVCERYMAAG